MEKRVYFDRKYDAETTRRMMEEVSGQRVELLQNHKGWYCAVDKDYLTKDGAVAAVGSVVYSLDGEYEIVEYNADGGIATIRVRPLYGTDGDKDKDVREGIVWYFDGSLKELRTLIHSDYEFEISIDGRRTIEEGDFLLLETASNTIRYKVKRDAERLKLKRVTECPMSLQHVEIVGNEIRTIPDIYHRRRGHYLKDFYSRPLTKRERFIAKLSKWNSDTEIMEILIPSLLMTGLFLGMLAFIFMFIRELSEVLH